MSEQEEWMEGQEALPEGEPVGQVEEGTPEAIQEVEASTPEPETAEEIAKIDLNTATVDELRQLPGIGEALAARIVNYREEIRPFEEPVEITAVRGISESMYANIADRLTVSPVVGVEIEVEAEAGVGVEELSLPEPEIEEPEEIPALRTKPTATETDKIPPPRPEPPLVEVVPAPVGWGRFFFVGLVSAVAGAILALLVLLGINQTLDYLGGNALKPVWTQAGELEDRMETLNTDLAQMRERLEKLQDLSLRLDDTQADVRRLTDGLTAARVEIDSMTGALDAMRLEVTNLREDLDGMAGQVDSLRQRVDEVEERLVTLDQELSAMHEAVQRFDAFLGGLRHLLNESMGPPTPTPWATPTLQPRVTVVPLATPTP